MAAVELPAEMVNAANNLLVQRRFESGQLETIRASIRDGGFLHAALLDWLSAPSESDMWGM